MVELLRALDEARSDAHASRGWNPSSREALRRLSNAVDEAEAATLAWLDANGLCEHGAVPEQCEPCSVAASDERARVADSDAAMAEDRL